jgi:hypothetical protein
MNFSVSLPYAIVVGNHSEMCHVPVLLAATLKWIIIKKSV